MSESRHPAHRLATASFVLGLIALGLTVVVLNGSWRGARLVPWERWILWWGAWVGRWAWGAAIAAVLSFGCGRVALRRLTRAEDRRAYLLARAGAVISLVECALIVFTLMFAPVFPATSEAEYKIECLSNVKDVALAIGMYAEDYDHYPASARWCDTLAEYTKNPDVYRCPEVDSRSGQAYNAAIEGASRSAIADPTRVIAVFDGEGGWNAHGGKELLPSFPRHLHGDNFGFLDGHVKWLARKRPAGGVRWNTVWPRELKNSRVQWQPKLREPAR